ncbi:MULTISPECIES: PspC domain-containing protein [unclassified Paraflavitalea]|uniref:PspC domain-containing protein n=1 Tax=unclassified Paraflavitalea TaxID=2798305 RepID=UPI003D3293C3
MKKVININFQGRVIPIEETAFEMLKQYIDSLRKYFANEEGSNEIINDIESRIAELFGERLKKGVTCITDEDVNTIIANMGRPEDFDAVENDSTYTQSTKTESNTYSNQQSTSNSGSSTNYGSTTEARGRLYRNDDDKIIGGVASGLANYFNIDPVVLRIVFVILFGALFWVYLLLWVVVPSKSMHTNVTKRLFRSSEEKVIAGVAGGLAAYFNVAVWIPRLIFAFPLIFGIFSGVTNFWWDSWDIWMGPRIITGSLGTTLFFTYVVLWIAVPVATTAAEKLEMKGEKIDVNSIKETVKADIESFKTRAEKWSQEVKQDAERFGERAKEFGKQAGSSARNFSQEAAPIARTASSGIGHIISVIFKAFFLFIGGIMLLALFGVLLGLLVGGFAIIPLKDFIIAGFWPNLLTWATLILFLGVPIVGLVTKLIRSIMGVKSKKPYLSMAFGLLWTVGLISLIFLISMVTREFKTKDNVEQAVVLQKPSTDKLIVDVEKRTWRDNRNEFWGWDMDEDWTFADGDRDSVFLNTVMIGMTESKDNEFHAYLLKSARGNTTVKARQTAEKIHFNLVQRDSLLVLPSRFSVMRQDKFRNQQVVLILEVPVGKKVKFGYDIEHYNYFDINVRRRGISINSYDNDYDTWRGLYIPEAGREYVMTNKGNFEDVSRMDQDALKRGEYKIKDQEPAKEETPNGNTKPEQKGGNYRYRDTKPEVTVDTAVKATTKIKTKEVGDLISNQKNSHEKEEIDELASYDIFARMLEL